MALRLHPPESLLAGVTTALERDRPVAFVLGSALSAPAVPDSRGVVGLVRDALVPYPSLSQALDTALATAPWGEEYATAMDLLQERSGADDVAAVVRRAVRLARIPGAPDLPDDQELELDLAGWQLTPGLETLGALLAHGTGGLAGPVLTLAWDPLLHVAVRRAGGRVNPRIPDPDGTLHRAGSDTGGVEIVHLHGFWREPESLLQRPSPRRLAEGLVPLLRDHAIVVLGAGPRDGAVLQALVDVAARDDAQATLSWAFHEADRVQVKADAEALLARTDGLSRKGRFRTFGGVDAHAWFQDLRDTLAPPVPEPAPPAPTEPAAAPEPAPPPRPALPGWTVLDSRLLKEAAAGDADHAGFAQGQGPTWPLVISGKLAERDRVRELETAIVSKRAHKRGWSVHLLLGPDGEGKSTAVRQVAARVARHGGPWRVWFRDQGGLRWDQVGPAVTPGTRVLLVSDSAEELLLRRDLDGFLDERKIEGRLKRCGAAVHVLLTANADAWRRSAPAKPKWLQSQAVVAHRSMHALTPAESRAFAAAATAVGQDGALATLETDAVRAAQLLALSAARDSAPLLGALVEARTGETLEAHVTAWLLSLRGKRTTRFPLPLKAWLHVAALQVGGLGSLDRRVLRAALETDDAGLDAALAALSGWLVPLSQGKTWKVALTSPAVAQTTLAVMDACRLGMTRAQVYASLATAAITGVKRYDKERRVQAIPKLAERLWRAGDRESGREMAAAAHAAAPLDATLVRVHARLLRESGLPGPARLACAAWVGAVRAEDPDALLDRVTVQEWAACARADQAGDDHAAWTAWLALFAMADQAGGKPRKDAIRGIIGIANALVGLDPDGAEPRAVQGRAAAVAALKHAPKGVLGERELKARNLHYSQVGDLWRYLSSGAVGACLSGVAKLAWERSDAPRKVPTLPSDGRLTFQGLMEGLQGR